METEERFRLLQRARIRIFIRRGLLLLLAVVVGYYAVAVVYATRIIYKVRSNYAVILDDLSGHRRVVSAVGWHLRLPFFTRLEQEVPLMNQELYLGGKTAPQRIMSRGNVPLWTSAMLTYRITNLQRWGIDNASPRTLLQNDFDGLVKDVLQGQPLNELISDRERIKEAAFRVLKDAPINEGGPTLEQKYGIQVVSFVLGDTRYGEKLAAASEEKKRRELIAEAENYAADQEASRVRKLYAAYGQSISAFRKALGLTPAADSYLFQFLNQQKWAAAYEKNQQGQNTFVLNNAEGSGSPPLVLPAPPVGSKKEQASENVQNPKDAKPGLRAAVGKKDQPD